MLELLIRVVAILAIFALFFYLLNNRVKEVIDLRRKKQSSNEDSHRVELLERKNTAEFEAATADERAEHEKARLTQETAEARVAAKIADDPDIIAARTAEEKQIIEARAEGRAQAAKERAASEHDGSSVAHALTDAYKVFAEHSNVAYTFEEWLGDVNADDLR